MGLVTAASALRKRLWPRHPRRSLLRRLLAATKPAPVEKAAAIADLEDRAGNSVAKESTRSATPAKTLAPVRAASAGPAAQGAARRQEKSPCKQGDHLFRGACPQG